MKTVYIATVIKANVHDWPEIEEEVFSEFDSALDYLYTLENVWLLEKMVSLDYSPEKMSNWKDITLRKDYLTPEESCLKIYVFDGADQAVFSVSKKEIDNII